MNQKMSPAQCQTHSASIEFLFLFHRGKVHFGNPQRAEVTAFFPASSAVPDQKVTVFGKEH